MDKIRGQEFFDQMDPLKNELIRFAQRRLSVPQDAEDILQEASFSAYAAYDRFTPGTRFRPWIYKFTANKIMNANKKARRNIVISMDEVRNNGFERTGADTPSFLDNPQRFLQDVGDKLFRALRVLGPTERDCLLLRSVDEVKYRDIAALLEIPTGTVMSHIYRARMKLKNILAGTPAAIPVPVYASNRRNGGAARS